MPRLPDAACKGMDSSVFFKESSTHDQEGLYAEARTVCVSCPERAACLQWAMETEMPWGMWGGLTPMERRQLRSLTAKVG